jgi:hypothetical protein
MIPKVRTWTVRVVETGEVIQLDTINKNMCRIIMRLDHPRTWGKTLKISRNKEFTVDSLKDSVPEDFRIDGWKVMESAMVNY